LAKASGLGHKLHLCVKRDVVCGFNKCSIANAFGEHFGRIAFEVWRLREVDGQPGRNLAYHLESQLYDKLRGGDGGLDEAEQKRVYGDAAHRVKNLPRRFRRGRTGRNHARLTDILPE
jgi:hypothetical protein